MDRVRLIESPCRITNKLVASLPLMASGQRYIYDERDGRFGVCLGKTRKSFFVEASIKGAKMSRRVVIGRFGDFTVEEARDKATELLAEMVRGVDPVVRREQDRDRQEAENKSTKTLREIWDQFRTEKLGNRAMKERSLDDYEHYLETVFGGIQNKDLKTRYPNWLDRPIKQITPEEVVKQHLYIGEERKKAAYANSAMRVLSSLCEFAKSHDLLKDNPVDVIRKRKIWFPEKRRQTFIRQHQLPAWFTGLEEVKANPDGTASAKMGCDYLEFLLFTGLRREEAATLTWQDVNFDENKLVIPGEKTKNGQDHALPLTDHLLVILKRRKHEAGNSPWVFAATGKNKGDGHISEPRYTADKVAAASGIKFMLHDLRRTFITTAESLDVGYYALKRLVNHKMSGDVTAGYVQIDAERLRKPMEQITNEFLRRAKAPENHVLKIA
ncbi:MAG: tyrosine-type recombinase/integrase [Phycisphaerae bacterium]